MGWDFSWGVGLICEGKGKGKMQKHVLGGLHRYVHYLKDIRQGEPQSGSHASTCVKVN